MHSNTPQSKAISIAIPIFKCSEFLLSLFLLLFFWFQVFILTFRIDVSLFLSVLFLFSVYDWQQFVWYSVDRMADNHSLNWNRMEFYGKHTWSVISKIKILPTIPYTGPIFMNVQLNLCLCFVTRFSMISMLNNIFFLVFIAQHDGPFFWWKQKLPGSYPPSGPSWYHTWVCFWWLSCRSSCLELTHWISIKIINSTKHSEWIMINKYIFIISSLSSGTCSYFDFMIKFYIHHRA